MHVILLLAVIASVYAKIIIHVVPHTHDDTGWLKTVDEYASGSNNTIQNACTDCILTSVTTELYKNPQRKFTYVEQAFFQRWWRVQDDGWKSITKKLVDNKQLQFINGGWCMHDEAAPHFIDMIDQTTFGHKFLRSEFNVVPVTGWQIDPFGHSATQAALLSAEVGFTSLFQGRIDYQDLDLRKKNKEAEFIWAASESLGSDAKVFAGLTGEYGGNYEPPKGFDWEGNDEFIVDDIRLKSYNVKSRVDDFVKQAQDLADMTKGDKDTHVMFTMGSDFRYSNALRWFMNMDRIIRHTNELRGDEFEAKYSTPNEYVEAKMKQSITWPTKTDDFFPYADDKHHFWTGYFTSRPAFKRYVRSSSSFFQSVKKVDALAFRHSPLDAGIETFAEAMAVAQHHDGVSGTSKQHVVFDYAMRIANGRTSAMPAFNKAVSHLLNVDGGLDLRSCLFVNETICEPSQTFTDNLNVVLWNSLGQPRTEVVEIPVDDQNVNVMFKGSEVSSEVVAAPPAFSNYGPVGDNGAKYMLRFMAVAPQMGASVYQLKKGKRKDTPKVTMKKENGNTTITNGYLTLTFCSDNRLCTMTNLKTGIQATVHQHFMYYNSSEGNAQDSQKSGAYIFRPNRSEPYNVMDNNGDPTLTVLTNTDLVQEIRQDFGWVKQSVKLAAGAKHAEIVFSVGPIPAKYHGREVITRFYTDIDNTENGAGVCYTDSNGREMQKRTFNGRSWPNFNQTEVIAGNYYPITTAMYIKDKDRQFTLLTDASQGGSGLTGDDNGKGTLEMMLHRRILKDDSRGVGEPLDETEFITPYAKCPEMGCGKHYGRGLIITGKHFLSLEKPADAAKIWRPLQDRVYAPLDMTFTTRSVKTGSSSYMSKPLPENLQVLTLSRFSEDQVLLRIGHQFGIGEDSSMSQPTKFDVTSLFPTIKAKKFVAYSLTANQELNRMARLKDVRVKGKLWPKHAWRNATSIPEATVIGPLEIKTWLIDQD